MWARRCALGAVLAAFLPVCLSGCAPGVARGAVGARLFTPDTVTHKAEFEVGTRPIVVIPFRDAAKTYYESGDGLDLATAVAGELVLRKAATRVVSDEGVRREFAGQDLERVGWAEVGKAAGAQLVLTGDIDTFRLKDPGVIGMLRGYCKVNVRVYDIATNTPVYAAQGVETYWPEYGAGVAASDKDPQTLRNELLARTAMKAVQRFYTWQKKIGPEPTRY